LQHYCRFLQEEFDIRKSRNGSYSMNAFARDLGLSASSLSRLLRGRVGLSYETANMLATKLHFSFNKKEIFLAMVESSHSRSLHQRKKALQKLKRLKSQDQFNMLDEVSFSVIKDWYCWAIYFMVNTVGFKQEPAWIAERIGILKSDAENAIQRLFKVGMLVEKNGLWIQKLNFPEVQSNVPSLVIREHHRQIIRRAERSLEHVDLKKRNHVSFMLPIDDSQYEEFSKMFDAAMTNIFTTLQKKSKIKTKVYALSAQLFPIEQKL